MKLLFTFLLIGLSVLATAQPAMLTVLYAEGPVLYRPSAASPWQSLAQSTRQMRISAAYEAKLANNAVLILTNGKASPVTLRNQAGVARLSDWMRRPSTDQAAQAMSAYFETFWQGFTRTAAEIDRYAAMVTGRKGRRNRGDGCTPPLMLIPDYDAVIPGDSAIRFNWKPAPGVARYTLAFYDNYDEEANLLYQTTTTDTTLRFMPDKPFLERGITYYWSVFPTAQPNCARYTITLAKTETFRQLEARVADLQRQLRTTPALASFAAASLYESHHYYPEAYQAYFQAHRLSPANTLFRDALAQFLARRGQPEQAKDLYVNQ